jgi:hypothetical protein
MARSFPNPPRSLAAIGKRASCRNAGHGATRAISVRVNPVPPDIFLPRLPSYSKLARQSCRAAVATAIANHLAVLRRCVSTVASAIRQRFSWFVVCTVSCSLAGASLSIVDEHDRGCGRRRAFAMQFRFTIRDLLWLTLVVALAAGWWLDHNRISPSVLYLPPHVMVGR